MKILPFIPIIILILTSCKSEPSSIQLYNGKNLEGWHMDVPAMDSLPDINPPFIVRNGNLVSLGEPRGHLITNNIYKNYIK